MNQSLLAFNKYWKRKNAEFFIEGDETSLVLHDHTLIAVVTSYIKREAKYLGISSITVHPDYRDSGRFQNAMLDLIRMADINDIFLVGTTQLFELTPEAIANFYNKDFYRSTERKTVGKPINDKEKQDKWREANKKWGFYQSFDVDIRTAKFEFQDQYIRRPRWFNQ